MTSAEFQYICGLVHDHSALVLEPGKEYLVGARLEPLARREGFASIGPLVRSLRAGPFGELHRKVVSAMTNNETSFFRDAHLFAMLKSTLLPELIARLEPDRSLNIWCAACSSGQEPYSVAMLLHEQRAVVEGQRVRIVASDLSREIIAQARSGRYTQLAVNRGLPANLLVRHFAKVDGAWELDAEIRRMVQFQEINLMHPWPFLPRMDIVFMRNVLIYLDAGTKKNILRRAAGLLAPGGYLILGSAESTTNLDESFEAVSIAGATCFRVKHRGAPPSADVRPPPPVRHKRP